MANVLVDGLMSYGDELMAAGHAMTVGAQYGRAVRILDRHGRPRVHDLWRGNPWISTSAWLSVTNGPGARPYLQYPFTRAGGARFTDWRARDHGATIYLTHDELAWAAERMLDGDVVIEPNLAREANPNKQWGKWGELVALGGQWVQLGPVGTRVLPGVRHVVTPTFRLAAACLSLAYAAILPEGGLHHAAAAVGATRVTVIFGGHTPPMTTGYPEHANLTGGAEACGRWMPCDHCRDAMAKITVDSVVNRL